MRADDRRRSGLNEWIQRNRARAVRALDLAFARTVAADELIVRREAGARGRTRGSTLVLFASYDRHGQVDPYVHRLLRDLVDVWDADVQFVTTAPRLAEEDVERLKPLCRTVVHRRNLGLDFGSWKVGLDLAPDWREYDRVVLANDSVYGPLRSTERLRRLLDDAPAGEARVVGATENGFPRPHLQSYFLAFNKAATALPFFGRFWSGFRFYRVKVNTIYRQEIGLSRRARAGGANLVALVPYEPAVSASLARGHEGLRAKIRRADPPVNPTHELWRAAVLDFDCPFLKGELLRINPRGVDDLADVPKVVSQASAYPWELIESHLERVGENAVNRRAARASEREIAP